MKNKYPNKYEQFKDLIKKYIKEGNPVEDIYKSEHWQDETLRRAYRDVVEGMFKTDPEFNKLPQEKQQEYIKGLYNFTAKPNLFVDTPKSIFEGLKRGAAETGAFLGKISKSATEGLDTLINKYVDIIPALSPEQRAYLKGKISMGVKLQLFNMPEPFMAAGLLMGTPEVKQKLKDFVGKNIEDYQKDYEQYKKDIEQGGTITAVKQSPAEQLTQSAENYIEENLQQLPDKIDPKNLEGWRGVITGVGGGIGQAATGLIPKLTISGVLGSGVIPSFALMGVFDNYDPNDPHKLKNMLKGGIIGAAIDYIFGMLGHAKTGKDAVKLALPQTMIITADNILHETSKGKDFKTAIMENIDPKALAENYLTMLIFNAYGLKKDKTIPEVTEPKEKPSETKFEGGEVKETPKEEPIKTEPPKGEPTKPEQPKGEPKPKTEEEATKVIEEAVNKLPEDPKPEDIKKVIDEIPEEVKTKIENEIKEELPKAVDEFVEESGDIYYLPKLDEVLTDDLMAKYPNINEKVIIEKFSELAPESKELLVKDKAMLETWLDKINRDAVGTTPAKTEPTPETKTVVEDLLQRPEEQWKVLENFNKEDLDAIKNELKNYNTEQAKKLNEYISTIQPKEQEPAQIKELTKTQEPTIKEPEQKPAEQPQPEPDHKIVEEAKKVLTNLYKASEKQARDPFYKPKNKKFDYYKDTVGKYLAGDKKADIELKIGFGKTDTPGILEKVRVSLPIKGGYKLVTELPEGKTYIYDKAGKIVDEVIMPKVVKDKLFDQTMIDYNRNHALELHKKIQPKFEEVLDFANEGAKNPFKQTGKIIETKDGLVYKEDTKDGSYIINLDKMTVSYKEGNKIVTKELPRSNEALKKKIEKIKKTLNAEIPDVDLNEKSYMKNIGRHRVKLIDDPNIRREAKKRIARIEAIGKISKTPQEFIQRVAAEFGLNVFYGDVTGRGVQGWSFDKNVRLKNRAKLTTFAHELAHATKIDRDLATHPELKTELDKARARYDIDASYVGDTQANKNKEAVAFIFSGYMTNPVDAYRDYPEISKRFDAHPEYKALQEAYSFYYGQRLAEGLADGVIKRDNTTIGEAVVEIARHSENMSRVFDSMAQMVWSDTWALEKLEKKIKKSMPEAKAKELKDVIRKIKESIWTARNLEGGRLVSAITGGFDRTRITSFSGDELYKVDIKGNRTEKAIPLFPLMEKHGVLDKKGLTEKGKLFETAMVLKRVEELYNFDKEKQHQRYKKVEVYGDNALDFYAEEVAGIPHYSELKTATERKLKDLGLEKEFEAFAKDWTDTIRGIVYDYLGRDYMTPEELKNFTKSQYYVPLFRDVYSETFGDKLLRVALNWGEYLTHTTGVGKRETTVKGFKGSSRAIISPFKSIAKKIDEIITVANVNHTAKEAVKLLKEIQDSGINIGIEEIPAKKIKIKDVSVDELKLSRDFAENLEQALSEAGYKLEDVLPEGKQLIGTIYKAVKNGRKTNVFFIKDKGKLRAFEIVDPSLYFFFDKVIYRNMPNLTMKGGVIGNVAKAWKTLAGLWRNSVIVFPGFKVSNFFQDLTTAAVNSEIPVSKRAKYYKLAIKEFNTMGKYFSDFADDGLIIGRNPASEISTTKGFKELLKEYKKVKEFQEQGETMKFLENGVRWYFDGLESLSRLAEYIYTREKLEPKLGVEEARRVARVRALDVTVNFSKSSPIFRWVSQFIPFTSAGLSAFKTHINVLKKAIEDPKRAAMVLAVFGIAEALTYLTNKDKSWYKGLSPFYLGLYQPLQIGNTVVMLRKGGLLRDIFWHIPMTIYEDAKDGELFEDADVYKDLWQKLALDLPAFGYGDYGVLGKLFISFAAGKSPWGTDIVPASRKNAPIPERYRTSTPLALVKLSQELNKINPALAFAPAEIQNALYITVDKWYKLLYLLDPVFSDNIDWTTAGLKMGLLPIGNVTKRIVKDVDRYYETSAKFKGMFKYYKPTDKKMMRLAMQLKPINNKISKSVNALNTVLGIGLGFNVNLTDRQMKDIQNALAMLNVAVRSQKGLLVAYDGKKPYYIKIEQDVGEKAIRNIKKILRSYQMRKPFKDPKQSAGEYDMQLTTIAYARQQLASQMYKIFKETGIIKDMERNYASTK